MADHVPIISPIHHAVINIYSYGNSMGYSMDIPWGITWHSLHILHFQFLRASQSGFSFLQWPHHGASVCQCTKKSEGTELVMARSKSGSCYKFHIFQAQRLQKVPGNIWKQTNWRMVMVYGDFFGRFLKNLRCEFEEDAVVAVVVLLPFHNDFPFQRVLRSSKYPKQWSKYWEC
jgi:hypothetical protein